MVDPKSTDTVHHTVNRFSRSALCPQAQAPGTESYFSQLYSSVPNTDNNSVMASPFLNIHVAHGAIPVMNAD